MVGVCRTTTSLNYFVNFLVYILIVSSVEFSTTNEFESILELRRSHKWPEDGVKSVTHVSVKDFGAKGDGCTSDTEAFKRAWKIVCSFSPSVLEVPRGQTFVVGPIDFPGGCPSKVDLLISGKIVAPEDPGLWEGWNPRRWLYFHGVDNLTVKGGGTIDGRGSKWWDRSCKINSSNPCQPAPMAVTFHRSNQLYVKNLELLNSQQMHMVFTECHKVKVTGLKVTAPPESPNTDGIHISASNHVSVKNVAIKTGDDCISIASHSSNVRLRNVTCGPGLGISIGSLGRNNSWAEVHDVLVDGAFLNNTDNGIRIKTWQGGTGFVEQVTFRNIVMENVSNPIIIDQYYCDSFVPCPNQTTNVKVNGVNFSNISGTSATIEAIRFACSDSFPCENLYLEDIQLNQALGEPAEAFCWNASGLSSGGAEYTRKEVPLQVVPSSSLLKLDSPMTSFIDMQTMLFEEEKTAYNQAISQCKWGGKIHPLAFIHHTSTYHASLCKLMEYCLSPAIVSLQHQLKEIDVRLSLLKEEAEALEIEALNRAGSPILSPAGSLTSGVWMPSSVGQEQSASPECGANVRSLVGMSSSRSRRGY